jgi:hypothetical protein
MKVMEELDNMKNYITEEFEYYSSYEYLRHLLVEGGHLKN